jgi:flagellar hook-associated protein 3 FlgL
MKTSSVSSHALSEAMRRSILDAQTQLLKGQKEASTGRLADVGLELGHRTSQTVTFRTDFARLSGIVDTNGLVASRLDATQSALTGVREAAQDFLDSLAVAHSGAADPGLIRDKAKAVLSSLTGALNTTVNGEYLFAGINTDVRPFENYFATPPSAASQDVATAFQAAFGMAQSSPAASGIAPAGMQTFLDGAFASLFDDPAWTGSWSNASSQNVRSRISPTEMATTGTNVNEPAFRKLAMAFTMVADLGLENLNDETARTVIDTAMSTVGEAIGQLTTTQANLGTAQDQVARSSERMSLQIDILNTQINSLESVDPYEAATRVNSLLTQIETSYALTGRIHALTLLNYL